DAGPPQFPPARHRRGGEEADRHGLAAGLRRADRADHRVDGAGDPGAGGVHPQRRRRHRQSHGRGGAADQTIRGRNRKTPHHHAETAYENAMTAMTEEHAKLKSATAATNRPRVDPDGRHKAAPAEMAQTEPEQNTAVETNQEDPGAMLIQKKNQRAAEATELK